MNDDSHDQPEQSQELQIQMPPDVQRGVYANQMLVTHSQEEFVLDFILVTAPAGVVNARVLVSPSHAKRIVATLQENVARYESTYGEIKPSIPAAVPGNVTAH
ncbi:MAG TPA: DUF3467 domain-containing protein [Mariprofundaceae bacterium]|nr:DUF3467 domain-containing protein [Mariprofundaceae bacterium]